MSEPSTPSSLSTLLAIAGAGSVILAAGLMMPHAMAEPETPTTTATAAPTSGTTYPTDSHGYVDTTARCDEAQTLMSYGRTERALVAICVDRDGELQYRGVRLSDNAALELPVKRGADGTLIAANDTVTYSISPSMLLVSDGDSVIYRDSWLEYKEPNFSGTSTSSTATTSSTPTASTTPTATTTVTATPSVTTTTVTVTTTPPKPPS
jgi:hypothetical protein